MLMRFELLTLSGAKFKGDILELSLQTASGKIGVLPHHEPLTTISVPGPVSIRLADGSTEIYATFGGILEVERDSVRLLADEAEHLDELIQSEIEAALKKARQMKAAAREEHELHLAQEVIDRHEIRLEVVRLNRHGRR